VIDRRIAWLVLGLATLLAALALLGFARGSVVEAGPAAVVAVGLFAAGVALALRRRAAERVALGLCFAAAVAMAARATQSGRVLPALPVGALALALAWTIAAERRRVRARQGRDR
jgi:hypothetical protein